MSTFVAPLDNRARLRVLLLWMAGFVAIAVIGGALTLDLTGISPVDRFIVSHWGFRGLRFYLWFEVGVLFAIICAIGWSAIDTGLTVARSGTAAIVGVNVALRTQIQKQLGYVLVLAGSALIALALTTLVLFNSCRYMRIV